MAEANDGRADDSKEQQGIAVISSFLFLIAWRRRR